MILEVSHFTLIINIKYMYKSEISLYDMICWLCPFRLNNSIDDGVAAGLKARHKVSPGVPFSQVPLMTLSVILSLANSST